MTNLTPLFDKIIVKPFDETLVSAGGILLLSKQEGESAPLKGVVVSVGPGRVAGEMQVKPGDNILFSPHAGLDIAIDGKPHILMQQSAVLATFTVSDPSAN